jgi:hypothetical protein
VEVQALAEDLVPTSKDRKMLLPTQVQVAAAVADMLIKLVQEDLADLVLLL